MDTRTTRVLLVEADRPRARRVPAVAVGERRAAARARSASRRCSRRRSSGSTQTSVEVEADGRRALTIAARTVVWAAGVTASPLAGLLAAATGAETDRAGRLDRRARPDPAGPSRGVRARRHGHRARDSSCPASRRSRCSRAATSPARSAPAARAVPLPRQGRARDDRPLTRSRRRQGRSLSGLRRVGAVARHPPHLSRRLPEPAARADALDVQLRHARPQRARHPPPSGAAGVRHHARPPRRRRRPRGRRPT